MNSLLWKQWRETRTYLAFFMAWMLLAVLYAIGYELGHGYRAVVGAWSSMAQVFGIVAAIILAVRVACGEQVENTLSFSASLPISMRRMATVRIVGAMAVLAIPIVAAAIVLSLALAGGLVAQAEPRGIAEHVGLIQRPTATLLVSLEQLWSVTVIAVMSSVELLLVLCLLGCSLKHQAQVGFAGAVLALGIFIASFVPWGSDWQPYVRLTYGALLPQSLVVHWGYAEATGGYADHELAPGLWWALALVIPLLLLLARLFVTRYGTRPYAVPSTNRWRFRIFSTSWFSYIPLRFPNRSCALSWLELRQSVPLSTYGLLFAFMLTIYTVVFESQWLNRTFDTNLRAELPNSTYIVAMLWAVVVGSGLYSADLNPQLGNFWRSRPISTGMWFWFKFVIGLVVMLVVLDGVTIAVSWTAPRNESTDGMSWAYVACFPIQHAMFYALAVLGTCWLRKPVLGGVVAIVGFTVLSVAITAFPASNHLEPTNVHNALHHAESKGLIDFTRHGYPLVYGMLVAASAVSALLASWAAKPLLNKSQ